MCAGLNGKGTLARLQGNLLQFIPQMLLYYPVVPSSQFTSSRDRISSILLSRGSSLEVDWQLMSLFHAWWIESGMESWAAQTHGLVTKTQGDGYKKFLCFPPYLKNILSQTFRSFFLGFSYNINPSLSPFFPPSFPPSVASSLSSLPFHFLLSFLLRFWDFEMESQMESQVLTSDSLGSQC